jgi:hypothetical protein
MRSLQVEVTHLVPCGHCKLDCPLPNSAQHPNGQQLATHFKNQWLTLRIQANRSDVVTYLVRQCSGLSSLVWNLCGSAFVMLRALASRALRRGISLYWFYVFVVLIPLDEILKFVAFSYVWDNVGYTVEVTIWNEYGIEGEGYWELTLRGIFPFKGNEPANEWRILNNKEDYNLYSSPNIIKVIKLRRTRDAELIGCTVACIQNVGWET